MRSTKIKKAVAVATAIGMIAVSPMTALAKTVEQVTVEGTGSKEVDAVSNDKAETGVSMTDGAVTLDGSVTVTGDVTVSNENASGSEYSKTNGVSIVSNGGKATVNVGGNVTADASQNNDSSINANGISTGANSTIDVGGSVVSSAKAGGGTAQGVYSGPGDTCPEYKADIHIGKDINVSSENGTAFGVNIMYNAIGSTTVDGDIDASGMYAHGIYIDSREDEYEAGRSINISVGGDLKAEGTFVGNGVYVAQNNKDLNITIEGDITSSSYGILVGGNTGTAKIVSGGTVSSKNAAIVVYKSSKGDEKAPDITVWKIESNSGSLVTAYDRGAKSDTYTETIAKSINYIIKADATENGETSSNGKIVFTGTSGKVTIGTGDKAKTYETAHQDEEITIKVETVKGYKYSLSDTQGLLTKNSDGSYTLKVPAGGGVDLRAVLEKIESDRRSSDGGRGSDREEKTNNVITLSADNLTDTAYPEQGNDQGWTSNGLGWRVKKPDGNYANNEWYYLSWNGEGNWYHFDERGYLQSGWLTDADGQRYYLYNAHDGQFGRMLTGWNEINGRWYFFNTAATGTAPLGVLFTNGTTPDGYTVDASGARVQ